MANSLAQAIRSGQIAPGEKLPPHRELASRLNVNITTITRAMAKLQEEKLIETRPGRGTRVSVYRSKETQFQSAPRNEPGTIDLSVNRPASDAYNHVLATLLPELSKDPRFESMKDYHPSEGPIWAREAAVFWLRQQGLSASVSQVVMCDGAQHGLALDLRAIVEPGETVLADDITYQGIAALCRSLDLNLVGVRTDERGMDPRALRQACLKHNPRVVFLVSSIQNPTAITLDEERRTELLAVIEDTGVLLIEDDVYRPLLDDSPAPLARRLPEQTLYLTSLSKCVAPGLRIGFMLAPPSLVPDISSSLRVDCWSIAPLSALVATRLIETGKARDLVVVQREELRARQAMLRQTMEGLDVRSGATAPHAWLTLPDAWRDADFCRACLENGVAVLPGSIFSIDPARMPNAVRINLSAAPTREQLGRALKVISRLAKGGPSDNTRDPS
ncbi:aminotransferase-like domain-containing protein [Stutzerimonas nitrititolerans]|uniref:aminotransferase-like domain-containing protein n=1 Tax=Stutzerimonas nitrititolerans TaxID=2482751 RepID=UPI00289A34BC|nr:PLP-dependent aminotransferase family protein [Stutzerimonas nitrititolerans]